jgi:glycosyltransferase involved in cell wall biosynthesis
MSPLSWPAGRACAAAFKADAWIVPYWTWAWAGLWLFLLRGAHPPAVAVVHNPADHDAGSFRRMAARSVLGQCKALFTHAASLERQLAETFPGVVSSSYPFPTTPLGSLPDRSAAKTELDLPPGRRMALSLGLIRPYKGVDLLLDAVAKLPASSNWFVVVAGEPWGGSEGALRQQVRELGLEKRVRLDLRWVPEHEVPRLLAAADLVVLPYRSGSQSAVAPMALAAGVPVLSTAVGGLPEIVRHGVDGWLVEPGSVDALTTVLADLDGPMLKRLADGAVEGRDRFTWDGYAKALEELIAKVI